VGLRDTHLLKKDVTHGGIMVLPGVYQDFLSLPRQCARHNSCFDELRAGADDGDYFRTHELTTLVESKMTKINSKLIKIFLAISLTALLVQWFGIDYHARKLKKKNYRKNETYWALTKAFAPVRAKKINLLPIAHQNINKVAIFQTCRKSQVSQNLAKTPASLDSFRNKIPPHYLNKFKQEINISTWLSNTHELYCSSSVLTPSIKNELSKILIKQITPFLRTEKNGLFFFNTFNFKPLDYELTNPWSSGLSQGMLLMGLQRLYQVTGQKKFQKMAEQTLFTFVPSDDPVQTTFYDQNSFYWIDEYPSPDANSFVLNGHIWGLIALHDYFAATSNETALTYLRKGISTVKNYIHL